MKCFSAIATLSLLIGLFLFSGQSIGQTVAQTKEFDLELGEMVTVWIEPDAIHRFTIKLKESHFTFLRLQQNGVDLKIRTIDPNGKSLNEFDSPNGRFGPEIVMLKSGMKGGYVVEVTPFDENELAGNYEIRIQKSGPIPTDLADQVDMTFLPWTSDQTPGVSIAVVKDGQIVLKRGYGIANLEYGIPIGDSTVFHIASVSKQFTVFSILLLERQGKLSLDDDIRKHIPEVPDFGTTITLRHLATHTSGLRDQWALLEMAGWRNDDVITKEHILKLVAKQKRLNFQPGDEFAYSNTGFTLLAEVVARVSGQTFAEFTDQQIFQPLAMSQTLFYDDHEKIVANRAYSYQLNGEMKKSVLNFANVGATSLFTTAEDLGRWALNFDSLKVGDASIVQKMNTLAVLNNGKTFNGALGQFVTKYKGLKEIQHSGGDAGYRSFLTRFPDQGLSVAVLSNSAEVNPVDLGHRIVDIYLKDQLVAETENAHEPRNDAAESSQKFDRSSVDLTEYTGRFFSEELSTEYDFQIVDGVLVAKHSRHSDKRLMPVKKDVFSGFFGQTDFVRNSDNAVIGLKVSNGRIRNLQFEKLD